MPLRNNEGCLKMSITAIRREHPRVVLLVFVFVSAPPWNWHDMLTYSLVRCGMHGGDEKRKADWVVRVTVK